MKVVVKDGRVLIGDLLCIDKQGNLILGNTYQQVDRQVSLAFSKHRRLLRLCKMQTGIHFMLLLL